MSTAGFLLAMGIIAILFMFVYIREKVKGETKEEEKSFPSGRQMLSDSEMLALQLDELRNWTNDDLRWLINYVGHQMGELWGKGVTRTAPGAYYLDENGNKVDCSNQVIINEGTGLTSDSSELQYLGNINPDWTGGLTTSLRWKDLVVGMTFSAQLGGRTYSVTAGILGYQGKLTNSLEGRYDGFVAPGVNDIGEDEDGNQICQVNKTLCSDVQAYYNKGVGNRYNFAEYTYDTSFIKMKELRIEYNLPNSLLNRQKVKILQGASIAAYATNLFCFSNYPFFDPEVGAINGGDIKRGIEVGSFPMNRSFGVNLKLKF